MASYEKIVGLSQALYEATAEVSRLSGEVSNLKYIKNKVKKYFKYFSNIVLFDFT